jgi:hypothetical protein
VTKKEEEEGGGGGGKIYLNKFDAPQTKPRADCHMGHPLIHHRTSVGTEHMHFLFHSQNQVVGTLHVEQLLDC